MIGLQLTWQWLWHWVLGWGGIGGAISIGAWLLWYFTPGFLGENKRILLHIAVAATVATLTSSYIAATEYKRGVQAAINAIAAKDQQAIERVKAGQSEIEACRARLKVWDVTTGTCQ